MTDSRLPKARFPRPPAVLARPAAAAWFFERGLRNSDVAGLIGKGREQVRRYFLPFDDPAHVPAPIEVIAFLRDWSGGELTPDAWVRPPRLGRPSASVHDLAEARR